MKKKKINYINNKSLYQAMKDYKEEYEQSKKDKKPPPQVSRYIGESILQICNNLAKKPNFSGYTYKGDMISDGIIDCVAAVNNFNPEKTNNPFAYFTQIAWNAFLRRIQKEKKQNYIKHKNFENTFIMSELANDSEYSLHFKTNENSDDFVKTFEEGLTKNKKKAKLKGVEMFLEKDIDDEEHALNSA